MTIRHKRALTLAIAAVLVWASVGLAGSGSRPVPTETAVVSAGRSPCGIAADGSSVWVAAYGTGTLVRIDSRGRVETRLRVGTTPCRIATGPAAVWVVLDRPGRLVRISLGSGRRRGLSVGSAAFDVLLAAKSAWATSFDVGTVARVDPVSAKLTRVFKVGDNPAGLAYCRGRIWVGHGRAATWITSIDPVTLRIRHSEVGARAPGWPTCIGGVVWVTTPDSVLRVDPEDGRVLSRLRIGETLADAAAGPDGLVWVTDKENSVVHRLDPEGRTVVDSFPAGPGAYALARTGRAMWVTSFAGSDVRRYEP